MRCASCGKDVADGTTVCPFCFSKEPRPRDHAASGDEDFAQKFNTATQLWKDNLGQLALFTLVFMLVGWIPILNAVFFAGYYRGLINLSRGGELHISDIFSAWDCFGNALAYLILLTASVIAACIIPFFGHVAQFAVAVFGAPGLFLVADRNVNAIDAVRWSINSVQKHFLAWLLAVLVGGLLGWTGLLFFVVGAILTMPWGVLLLIRQYEAVRDEAVV